MLSLLRKCIIVFILARACLKDFLSITQNMCKRVHGQSLDVCTDSILTVAVFPRTFSSISGEDAGDRVEDAIKFITASLSRPVCLCRYHQPLGIRIRESRSGDSADTGFASVGKENSCVLQSLLKKNLQEAANDIAKEE